MAVTALCTRGYSVRKDSISLHEIEEIKDDLTVAPFIPQDYTPTKPAPFKLFMESPYKLYLPKAYGLKRFGIPQNNKIPDADDIQVTFEGFLRNEQKEPVEKVLDAMRNPMKMGGVLSVVCGAGKTTMAIYIMCILKKKTLIVVHKEFLLQQWKERLQQFAPSSKIGLLKADKVAVEGYDVVIASLQSLSMKEYDLDLFAGFGYVIYDECHHTSAQVFSQAMKKTNFLYTLGLSATPKRKDGLTKVFLYHLGDIVYNSTKRNDNLQVNIYEYYSPNSDYSKEQIMFKGKLNVAKMINNICEFQPRITFIVDIIKDLLSKEPERRILLLSDRRAHLHLLSNALNVVEIQNGFFYGGLNETQLKAAEDKTVILATFAYIEEGFDKKGLDTLILASPKSDITQSSGRILRDKPEDRKHIPLIIDIVDNFSIFMNQARKRLTYYKKCKYDVEDIDRVFEDRTKIDIDMNKCLLIS